MQETSKKNYINMISTCLLFFNQDVQVRINNLRCKKLLNNSKCNNNKFSLLIHFQQCSLVSYFISQPLSPMQSMDRRIIKFIWSDNCFHLAMIFCSPHHFNWKHNINVKTDIFFYYNLISITATWSKVHGHPKALYQGFSNCGLPSDPSHRHSTFNSLILLFDITSDYTK